MAPLGCDDSRPMRHWHATKKGGQWNEHRLPVPAFIDEWNRRETSHVQFGTPVDVFRELASRRSALPAFAGVLDATMWTYWYGLNGNEGLRVWRARTESALVSAERFGAAPQ